MQHTVRLPPEPATTVAVAFDVYGTLVDPLRLADQLARLVPEHAAAVAARWRQTQLEYTFRLTAMERYEDFAWVTSQALAFALAASGQSLRERDRDALLAAYDELAPFDDVEPALARLHAAGHTLAVLSNGTLAMLDAVLRRAGLRRYFAEVISVDEVRAYTPSPRVYRHLLQRLDRPPQDVYLVSSNQFDVIGARAAGLRAAWVNRRAEPLDPLAAPPPIVVSTLADLAAALDPPPAPR